MTTALPLGHVFNLGRLGKAGASVAFAANADARAAIARWSDILSVQEFSVTVDIAKPGPASYRLEYRVVAALTQACVVTLEPVPARLERRFTRDLHFTGAQRHGRDGAAGGETVLDLTADEGPEDIANLHYDLAGPALEEYSMALDPYPRKDGARFASDDESSETDTGTRNPFAVLGHLKKPG